MHTSCNAQVLLDMELLWIFAPVREKWRCSLEVSRFSCGPAFLYATVLAACDVSTPDIPMDFPMLVASMAADSGAFSPAAFQEESGYRNVWLTIQVLCHVDGQWETMETESNKII